MNPARRYNSERRRIVRPHLESHFVSSGRGRPSAGGVEQRSPESKTTPPENDEHSNVGYPIGRDFDRDVAHEPWTTRSRRVGHQHGGRRLRDHGAEARATVVTVEWDLDPQPTALCGDGPELLDQLVEIFIGGGSDNGRMGRPGLAGVHRLSLTCADATHHRAVREAGRMSDAPNDPGLITPGPLIEFDDPNDPRLDLYRDLNDPAGRIQLDADQSVFVVEEARRRPAPCVRLHGALTASGRSPGADGE